MMSLDVELSSSSSDQGSILFSEGGLQCNQVYEQSLEKPESDRKTSEDAILPVLQVIEKRMLKNGDLKSGDVNDTDSQSSVDLQAFDRITNQYPKSYESILDETER